MSEGERPGWGTVTRRERAGRCRAALLGFVAFELAQVVVERRWGLAARQSIDLVIVGGVVMGLGLWGLLRASRRA